MFCSNKVESLLQCAGSWTVLISKSIHFPDHSQEIKPIQGLRKLT